MIFLKRLTLLTALVVLAPLSHAQTVYNQFSPPWFNCGGAQTPINNVSVGTSYTLVLTDVCVDVSATANPFTLTVPTNASVAFPLGTTISIRYSGSISGDSVSVVGAGGVTLQSDAPAFTSFTLTPQYGRLQLNKIATNTWQVINWSSSPLTIAGTSTASAQPVSITTGPGLISTVTAISAGSASLAPNTGYLQCNANATNTGTDYFYTQTWSILGNGQSVFCFSDLTGYFIFDNNDTNDGTNVMRAVIAMANASGNGPAFLNEQDGSTTCTDGTSVVPSGGSFTTTCSIFETGISAYGSPSFSGKAYAYMGCYAFTACFEGVGSNRVWFGVGNTTPVIALNMTSTGTNQASVTLGEAAHTTSTATVQADGVSLAFSNLAITETGITTGTNADTMCISASGVLLLQAAPCTISSERFKQQIFPLADAAQIMGLKPIHFSMRYQGSLNPDPNFSHPQVGLSAENVAAVIPDCAVYENDMKTPKSYRPECIDAFLVKVVQDHQRELERDKIEILLLMAWCLVLSAHAGLLHFRKR